MRNLIPALGLALLASTSIAGSASANIIFSLGNTGGIGETNILFQQPETGASIVGQIDHTGIPTVFNTLTGQVLSQVAQGQADITCAAGCVSVFGKPGLDSIEMHSPGFAYTDAIINLNNGTGLATVVVSDNLGNTFTYTLGHGQNFLTMIAEAGTGEFITDIKVNMNGTGGWEDFKQPRVSGVCELVNAEGCIPIPPVPEPGSIALLGSALLGLGAALGLRRRRS